MKKKEDLIKEVATLEDSLERYHDEDRRKRRWLGKCLHLCDNPSWADIYFKIGRLTHAAEMKTRDLEKDVRLLFDRTEHLLESVNKLEKHDSN